MRFSTRLAVAAIFVLLVANVVATAMMYESLPDTMASHWNAAGEVDGTLPKAVAVSILPGAGIVIMMLLLVLPWLDPLRKNYASFRGQYNALIVLISMFLSYINALQLYWNVGGRFDMGVAIVPALGVLYAGIGVVLRHAKQNWFVGIRTPWTLSSEESWTKTHALGAKMFLASGAIAMLGIAFPRYALVLGIVPVLVSTIVLAVYSYVVYRHTRTIP